MASDIKNLKLGIVCPMANEGSLAIRFVNEVLSASSPFPFREIVFIAVVDAVSKDDTLDLLLTHSKIEARLKVVWAPQNKSVVDAYIAGYRFALADNCDWILEIDAGFSHLPEDIPQFLDSIDEDYDCVFGSRFGIPGSAFKSSIRRLIYSRGGSLLANLALGTKLTDMTSGFELFSRKSLESVLERGVRSRGPFFQTEIKAYCRRMRFKELPIRYSGASHSVGRTALLDSFRNLFFLLSLRLSGRL